MQQSRRNMKTIKRNNNKISSMKMMNLKKEKRPFPKGMGVDRMEIMIKKAYRS
jgi:hypothetical protein